jgi:H+-transporting ATPase
VKLLAYRIFDPVKAEPKPEAKAETPSDLTPQIAKRAYELYEKRGRQSDPAVQDWEQAKGEILKDEANAEAKLKVEPKPDAKAEPKPETKAKTPSDLTPQIVKRVHKLYEELGRQDLQAVEDLEKAERENRKDDK